MTAKRSAPKRKPAAKKEPEIQRDTVTESSAPEEEQTQPVQPEETDADRAAAGEARRQKVMTPQKDPEKVYEPERIPLEHEDFDQHAAEEKRLAELQEERDRHNSLTGDASRT